MLRAAFDHLIHMKDGGWRCAQFAAQVAPNVAGQSEIIDRALAERVFYTSVDLGELFELSCAERSALKITTIACVDVSRSRQAEVAREKRNARAKERRAADRLKKATGEPRGRVSDRADAIMHVLSRTDRWMKRHELSGAVEWLRQFSGPKGRPLRRDSLSKAVRLACRELEQRGLIESRLSPTKFNVDTLEYRRHPFGPSRPNFRAQPGNENRVVTKEPGNSA
jgi:hypothetical protein